MHSKRTRLDRYISKQLKINPRDVKLMLARNEIFLDGLAATNVQQYVDEFTQVVFKPKNSTVEVLQNNKPFYIMLNKPTNVVSATKDEKHTTVIDLLDRNSYLPAQSLNSEERASLHITGRLDFNSTGLLLLTNNGRWSKALFSPTKKIKKHYRVTLENPVTEDYVSAFAKGMHFAYEDIHTQPAQLIITGSHSAEVVLVEGRYHQIKRMFGRFQNKVLTLHRIKVGNIKLDSALKLGQWRMLTAAEVELGVNKGSDPQGLTPAPINII